MKPITAFGATTGLLVLQLICVELHELGHHFTGRLVCGCWGTRDFYNWALCPGCERKTYYGMATIAGPLVNVILCWVSALFFKSSDPQKKSIALYLLFANLPVIRWLAVAEGGGDEFVAIKQYWGNYLSWYGLRALAFTIETILFLPPLWIAYQKMKGKWKPLWFALLCFVPGFFMPPMLNGLNTLLVRGFLSEITILQIPLLVIVCFLLCIVFCTALRKEMHLASFYLTGK